MRGEVGQGARHGASEESEAGSVGRQEDAVPLVSRWYERERQEAGAWRWREEEAQRPREAGQGLGEGQAEQQQYVAACLLAACCLACCLAWWDGRGAIRPRHYAERCRRLLERFMNYKDLVVRLQQCLWRFQTLEGVRHDDLLVYVAEELQQLADTYQRQVLLPRRGKAKMRRQHKKR